MDFEPISLAKFLSRYENVYGVDLKRITHEEACVLFPELERARQSILKTDKQILEYIKAHREEILLGKIALVKYKKYIIPYYTPEITDDMREGNYFEREEVPFEIDDEIYDYEELNEYELRELLRRKYNSYRNQVCARRELNSRGISVTKKYRRSEFKKYNYEEE